MLAINKYHSHILPPQLKLSLFFAKLVSSACSKVVYILVNTHLLFSPAPFLNFLSIPLFLSLHPSISLRQHSSSSLTLPFHALQLFLFWFPLPTRLSLITASSLFPPHIFSLSSSIDLFLKSFETPWMVCIQVWPLHPGPLSLRTFTCVNPMWLQGQTSERTGSAYSAREAWMCHIRTTEQFVCRQEDISNMWFYT